MADKSDSNRKKESRTAEDEVWSAIAAFEQILEAMPNDRASLETLAHAYAQIGDHTRAKEYMMRLARVVVDEMDPEAATELVEKLGPYVEDDPEGQQLLVNLTDLSSGGRPAEESDREPEVASAGSSRRAVSSAFDMSEEMAFAWNLLEAQELTQEEYSSVVQDLTEMSAGEAAGTISLLHVLDGRAFKNLDRILVFSAKKADAPIVSLSNFDLQRQSVSLLPIDFMVRRGAIVFELMGNAAMVAVMNPFDRQLRKDVESATGRKCHFFLSRPAEFDQAIEKAGQLLAVSDAGEGTADEE